MRRGTLRVAMTVLAVLALGACTGDEPGDPRTFPPYTAPASPTPTPTPTPTPDAATPPERPDMSTVDAETAEAVAVYFMQLFPYAAATGDLSDWNLLSHPECVFCADVRAEVESVFAAGHRSRDGLIHVSEASTSQVSDDWWLVTLRMVQDPSTTRDASGRVVEDFPETKSLRMDIAVVTLDGRLVVREVDSTRED